jgi:hypothetical protein
MRLIRFVLWFQSIYTLITAVWPLIDIESFMAVTGPKNDIWLVKTVGALLIPVAICLLSYLFIRTDYRPAFVLGSLTAIAFICVDCYYALHDVISDIYLADAGVEFVILALWIFIFFTRMDYLKNLHMRNWRRKP